MQEKKKIITISDSPYSPSGVGMQTRYMIEALLATGKYTIVSLAGAIRHNDYSPIKSPEHGADWVTYPVDNYGSEELIRSLMINEKPDVVWIMTDPRFWTWLWAMENEIREKCPLVYYHVWDNYPYPKYNKTYYDSNDLVVTISKVTDDIVRTVSPDVECKHLPHAVPSNIFYSRELVDTGVINLKENTIKDRFVFFWNNRNARRKQSGSLIFWFKDFLDIVGHDKAVLIMHTEPKDPNGQDLEAILSELELTNGEVMISTVKTSTDRLADLYNMADCTINISDAEGFGLATLESLSCGTPIIVNMTGGLQEQVTDGVNWFGIGLEPASKAIIGSQSVPYIYEDRVAKKDVLGAMLKIYNMSESERKEMGEKGRAHVIKNYGFDTYAKTWNNILSEVMEKHGSWDSRKNYKGWELREVS